MATVRGGAVWGSSVGRHGSVDMALHMVGNLLSAKAVLTRCSIESYRK